MNKVIKQAFKVGVLLIVIVIIILQWPSKQSETKFNSSKVDNTPGSSQRQSTPSKLTPSSVDTEFDQSVPNALDAKTVQVNVLMEQIISNIKSKQQINVKDEKALIELLQQPGSSGSLAYIQELLVRLDTDSKVNDSVVAYMINLLIAVNKPSSHNTALQVVAHRNWQNSTNIYDVSRSIRQLKTRNTQSDMFINAHQSALESNPFLIDLAVGIADNANSDDIDYLFRQINAQPTEKAKSSAVALTKITNEGLVPTISNYLIDKQESKQEAAINSLANMGQYEATVALIKWSATQPSTKIDQIKKLFDTASKRSPSTRRAIKKEVPFLTFKDKSIEKLVISYGDYKPPREN